MIQIGDTVHDVSGSVYYSMLSLARCATVPAGSYVCLLGLGNVACSLFMLLCDRFSKCMSRILLFPRA